MSPACPPSAAPNRARRRSRHKTRFIRSTRHTQTIPVPMPPPDVHPRSRGAMCPSFAKNIRPEITEGAGNAGRSMRPQPRVQNKKAHEHSHHGHTGNHPAFPAQWFYGLFRALPGDQALLSSSPALLLADLTPTLGRQNHTTSPYASASFVRLAIARLTPPRPPHPAPRS
jgi:hypothetical protein